MFGVMPPFREITTGQKRSPLAVLTRLVILTTRFIGDPPYLGLLYHLLYHSPYDIKNKRTGGESGIRLFWSLLSLTISSTSPGTYTIAIVYRTLQLLTAVAGVAAESQLF